MEGIDSFLESPVYVPLTAGKDQQFKIRVRNAERVQLRVGQRSGFPCSGPPTIPSFTR